MDITLLAQAAWILIGPWVGKAADKALEKVGEEAGGKLWKSLEPRLSKPPVEVLAKNPQDSAAQKELLAELVQLLKEDPALLAQVQALTGNQGNAVAIGQGAAAATGQAVAIGSVQGNVTFNR